jgi:hypothetical protein
VPRVEARERIRRLLVLGDNRLKQGRDERSLARARESYEEALRLASANGLDAVRPLVEVRLADLDRRRGEVEP